MEDSWIRIAAQAGFKSLYHYQDFKVDLKLDVERVTDILRNHRIYCSNPADFNDPWDCKPFFDPDLTDDPAIRAKTVEYVVAVAVQSGLADSPSIQMLQTDPIKL